MKTQFLIEDELDTLWDYINGPKYKAVIMQILRRYEKEGYITSYTIEEIIKDEGLSVANFKYEDQEKVSHDIPF